MSDKETNEPMYRVVFKHQNEDREIYARYIYQSDLSGFVELEHLEFGERSRLVNDPGVEQLRNQFTDVKRTFIPLRSIVRIDEMSNEPAPSFSESLEPELRSNITHFPTTFLPPRDEL